MPVVTLLVSIDQALLKHRPRRSNHEVKCGQKWASRRNRRHAIDQTDEPSTQSETTAVILLKLTDAVMGNAKDTGPSLR
jgi:hypothetical protein